MRTINEYTELRKEKFFSFVNANREEVNNGFISEDKAYEYLRLFTDWDTNIVSLGLQEKNGKYYPQYNVFD